MAAPGNIILVSFVENVHPGKRFMRHRNDWPYHITLVPWFEVADMAVLDNELTKVSTEMRPFVATVGEQRAFGVQGEIPVNVIDKPEDFRRLHTTLLSSVTKAGATGYDMRWTNEAYQPHITRHYGGNEGFEPGFHFEVPRFYVVRLEANNICAVESYYEFGAKA